MTRQLQKNLEVVIVNQFTVTIQRELNASTEPGMIW